MVVVLSAVPHKAAGNFSQKLPAAECTTISAWKAPAEKRNGRDLLLPLGESYLLIPLQLA